LGFSGRTSPGTEPNWTRFLAEQRRGSIDADVDALDDEVAAAFDVLEAVDLAATSDASKAIDQVASKLLERKPTTIADWVRLAQIAAKLNVAVGPSFRFVTKDRYLRAVNDVVLCDLDGTLEVLLPEAWGDAQRALTVKETKAARESERIIEASDRF